MNPEVVAKVNKIIHEKFEVPVEKLTPQAHLKNDLKLDSLDFVDMIVFLEQSGKMNIENIDFTTVLNLSDVYVMVEKITADQKH